jgi:predicted ATP-dependent endonuclease of OLD family
MKLDRIKIESFKSIVNQEILINNNCIGFIGLNESGKTNVLKSLNHLDRNKKFNLKDKSKITNELPSIKYHFSINEKGIKQIQKQLEKKIPNSIAIIGTLPFINKLKINSIIVSKKLVLNDSEYETEYILDIDFDYTLNKKYKVFIPNEEVPDNYTILFEDKAYGINNYYFDINLIEKEYVKYFKDIDDVIFKPDLESILIELTRNIIPEVKYWEFNSQYLVPAELTYEKFMEKDNPYGNNAPLYNMFLISTDLNIYDRTDLKRKIAEWTVDSSVRRKDSNILTRDVNKHIKSIWEDYDQELKIELEESKITIHVNDPNSSIMNYYDMGVRSQGFKTFMSFILTISAEAQTGLLENYFLILDEPEIHLHPSGVKYMKNELLKLSHNNNYVFFATHSIFMIDRSNLKRHIIVNKESERTKLTTVNRNNILQEDVIFQALGTSVDEFSLSKSNILFEGELDVLMFSYFIEKCLSKKENKLKDFEFLDGGGTKRILRFFTDKSIPKTTKWIIILDNDSPGRNLPESLKKSTINEVYKNFEFKYYSTETDYELEDILPLEIIDKSIKNAMSDPDIEITFDLNLDQDKPISRIINEFYGRNKINGSKKEIIEERFKVQLDIEVKKLLGSISKETSINSRLKKYKAIFPDYFVFLKNILVEYGIEIN